MVEMTISGKTTRGRPKKRWMDLLKEDMEMVGAKEGDEVVRILWRKFSRFGDLE